LKSDPTIPKSELSILSNGFAMGLRTRDPVMRNKFFEIWQKSVARDIRQKLDYILAQHSWEHMGSYFWIKQVT
jgi:transformation/transcription domain-associated protein